MGGRKKVEKGERREQVRGVESAGKWELGGLPLACCLLPAESVSVLLFRFLIRKPLELKYCRLIHTHTLTPYSVPKFAELTRSAVNWEKRNEIEKMAN